MGCVIILWSVISVKIGALLEDGDFSEEVVSSTEEGALLGRFCGRERSFFLRRTVILEQGGYKEDDFRLRGAVI